MERRIPSSTSPGRNKRPTNRGAVGSPHHQVASTTAGDTTRAQMPWPSGRRDSWPSTRLPETTGWTGKGRCASHAKPRRIRAASSLVSLAKIRRAIGREAWPRPACQSTFARWNEPGPRLAAAQRAKRRVVERAQRPEQHEAFSGSSTVRPASRTSPANRAWTARML